MGLWKTAIFEKRRAWGWWYLPARTREQEVSRDPTPESLVGLRDRPARGPRVLPRHFGLRGEHRHAHGRLGPALVDGKPEGAARPGACPRRIVARPDVRRRD